MLVYPEHPGKELGMRIQSLGMNLSEFARMIDVSSSRVSELVSCKRAVTIDSAMKLADAFSMKPEYWLTKQNTYDLFVKSNK